MSASLELPWTRDAFLAWAETQEARFEFDGLRPLAMTAGSLNHSAITVNILAALLERLRGTACRPLGPDAGVATVGQAVRYPDAVITCSPLNGPSRLVTDHTTIFEVVSPSSVRVDRILKVEEYRAIASLLRYVIVEVAGAGLLVLERASGSQGWIASGLTAEDRLAMPELGIAIPVSSFYEGMEFSPLDAC